MKPILLSIDPSVRDLGYAIINLNRVNGADWFDLEDEAVWRYGPVQMKARSITHRDPYYLQYRWKEAYYELKAVFDNEGTYPSHFAAEWPVYFNSMKGRIAAQRNYTVELGSIVGYLAGQFNFKANHMTLWTPMQWKGSVPKHVTKHRFVRTFGKTGERLSRMLSDDVIDAIMIAKHWLTLYARKRFAWQHSSGQVEVTVNKL